MLLARALGGAAEAAAEGGAQGGAGGDKLRVLQFNTLADGLAQHGDFLRCDARSLQWGARQPLLEAEIFRLKPDIIGLQGACPRAPKTENGVMQAAAEGRARDAETRQRDARGEAHGKACRLLR